MRPTISAPELCAALGISRDTLARWIVAGKIPPPTSKPDERRKWPSSVAVEILTDRGLTIPAAWSVPERVAA